MAYLFTCVIQISLLWCVWYVLQNTLLIDWALRIEFIILSQPKVSVPSYVGGPIHWYNKELHKRAT